MPNRKSRAVRLIWPMIVASTCSMLYMQPLSYDPVAFLKYWIATKKYTYYVGTIKINQSRGVKRKMTECKLKNCVNWPGALKQRDIKQGIKKGMGLYKINEHQISRTDNLDVHERENSSIDTSH